MIYLIEIINMKKTWDQPKFSWNKFGGEKYLLNYIINNWKFHSTFIDINEQLIIV